MKVIYCCNDGLLSSRIMAAIHLKMLPEYRPAEEDIVAVLKSFKKTGKQKKLYYVSKDKDDNLIFTLAVENNYAITVRAVKDFLRINGYSQRDFILVKSPEINCPWFKIRGLFSDRDKITARWIKKNYGLFLHKVKYVKQKLD